MTKKNENKIETVSMPGVEIAKMEMPSVSRAGGARGPRGSKYDFILDLKPGEVATFSATDPNKAASLRTALFGVAKKRGRKIKTVFSPEDGKLFICLLPLMEKTAQAKETKEEIQDELPLDNA
jgi:hypothetical protein